MAPAAFPDLAAGFVALFVVTLATWGPQGLPASYLPVPSALYLVLCGVILRYVPVAPKGPGLGAPNRVTLLRATLVLPVAALVLHAGALEAGGYWWIVGIGTVALILDGVDGCLARHTDSATPFGARFDMELDAFLILVLSALVWQSGQTGPWVLLIGAARYLFIGAGWLWPSLRRELPPSRRRKAVCAAQGIVLLACLAPVVPAMLVAWLAAAALGSLLYSFTADVAWLVRTA